MRMFLCIIWVGSCFAEITLFVNPQQYFNNTDNYANRQIYFFVQKNADGSVSLQVEPPPFYPSDQSFLQTGIAYIDSAQVLQTYTAEEVATLGEVDITFTVQAIPNVSSPNGYVLLGTIYQWVLSLDPLSSAFYSLQSGNLSGGNGLDVLNTPNPNADNNFLVIYSNITNFKYWASVSEGLFMTNSLIENTLVNEPSANTPISTDITITIDLSQIETVAVGNYSTYFLFQMSAIEQGTTFLETITALSTVEQAQINYLSSSIIGINAYLDSNNALYDPSIADQVVLRTNKNFLLDQYNEILAAITILWDGYAALPNLSSDETAVIVNMQAFNLEAQNNIANFQLEL